MGFLGTGYRKKRIKVALCKEPYPTAAPLLGHLVNDPPNIKIKTHYFDFVKLLFSKYDNIFEFSIIIFLN